MMPRAFRSDERGVAAVEFALVGGLLIEALFNVAEVSRYAYLAMEVTSASQAAAQAAIVFCDTTHVPVTTNCPGVTTPVTTALQGTSLGANITLSSALQEDWYCVTPAGALQKMPGGVGAKPVNCAAAGDASGLPGLYVKVNATYQYQAMFPGLTIAATFPANIARSAWMRVL